MTQAERDQVGKILVNLAVYYGRPITKEVVSMMVDDLEELSPMEIQTAITKYRRDPKNRQFPLPAQLLAIVRPAVDPDSAAREIAARINHAIVKFGWCNAREAENYIGEIGWNIVESSGGWSYLCQNHGLSIDPGVFSAQVRERAKTAITHSPQQIAIAIGARDSILLAGDTEEEMPEVSERMKLVGRANELVHEIRYGDKKAEAKLIELLKGAKVSSNSGGT